MAEKHFNLVDEPWIQVIDQAGQQQAVSLLELFDHAQDYRQLAGEMHSQDLAILRFLLAILTTVYSRFNVDGQPYAWLEIDPETMQIDIDDEDDLNDNYRYNEDVVFETWHALHERRQFTPIVSDYLKHYRYRFDLLDDTYPFYQLSRADYDAAVPTNKQVAHGKGTLAIKQMNRTVSESNNTRDVFSPRTAALKNKLDLPALTRWLIMYQNFTGVTDKTKVKAPGKFSVSKGWLYGLRPVFVKGDNLFETLMLNLDLSMANKLSLIQHPVWEADPQEYIAERVAELMPDNLAELYTLWSRALHIEWEDDQPTIFTAGLPKADSEDSFIEPMTTWKRVKKSKDNFEWKPDAFWISSMSRAMWRNFGEYVPTNQDDAHEPGIVDWVKTLQDKKYIAQDYPLKLTTVGLVSDGNATSQMPAAEIYDQMQLHTDVLFDSDPESRTYWPARIEEMIEQTGKVGTYYWQLARNAGALRGMAKPGDYARQLTDHFYDSLNEPFYDWLASLTNHDDRDQKCDEWRDILRRLAFEAGRQLLDNASPQEIRGKVNDSNVLTTIFTHYRRYNIQISLVLGKKKESRVANEQ